MKNRAFTLIELLVVVLIIGILTSIAVPKYKTAVKTSKLKSVLPIIKSIAQAEQAYFLANGTYTKNLADLDINVPYIYDDGNNHYYTDWGHFVLYDSYSIVIFRIPNVAQIEMPYDFPQSCAGCYNDNREVCHKFGTYVRSYDNNSDIYKICQF